MKKIKLNILFILCCSASCCAQINLIKIVVQTNEMWWCGIINHGQLMPFSVVTKYSNDLLGNNEGNQVQPLLLSNKGRFIWSEEPFKFSVADGTISVTGLGIVDTGKAGKTLKEVQQYVRKKYFPADGKMPDTLLVTKPQYNTWIELNYNQNQQDVLKYAHAIIDNGLAPGVLMIDDTWQENYGVWDFYSKKFPDPKKMMDELHSLGFKVMLWICPFVSADSKEYRELSEKGALLKDSSNNGESLLVKWWNGFSAELDFTNPIAVNWFQGRLNYLQNMYGVDGYKLDAGDFEYYPPNLISMKKVTANEHSRLFATIGLKYPLNEYRACWKMGGKPLVQRLRDKAHNWVDIKTLIPDILLQGLVGYTYACPDMIGGGEIGSFWGNKNNLDQDLIVRSAQCHGLMPMMQFSVAPWRVLDSVHFDAIKKVIAVRNKFMPVIMELVRATATTGEPIVKYLEYVFPNQGLSTVNDQFLLGDNIMVAPMLESKNKTRIVRFPKLSKGKWMGDDGKIYKGGTTVEITVPLDRLPYFVVKEN
ncbi:glycoside hydrolase family 31 protein [Ferruginibacter sp.]|uniref:glycoside hydrolase family 31 protein n=1 Tax=Ferruginibacter sp. TaxID=1940288 RepID=UPI0019AB5581|nr:glycoside hydrolase family 31 protein [Ferruginibacter sp.]MBC7626600.1 glycoside hydrolase [Ferruginibacter sp.]